MFTLHHVALSVTDIETSIAFYTSLDFEPVYRWQAKDEKLTPLHI